MVQEEKKDDIFEQGNNIYLSVSMIIVEYSGLSSCSEHDEVKEVLIGLL